MCNSSGLFCFCLLAVESWTEWRAVILCRIALISDLVLPRRLLLLHQSHSKCWVIVRFICLCRWFASEHILLLGCLCMCTFVRGHICQPSILQTACGNFTSTTFTARVQSETKMNWLVCEVKGQDHDKIKCQKLLVHKCNFALNSCKLTVCRQRLSRYSCCIVLTLCCCDVISSVSAL